LLREAGLSVAPQDLAVHELDPIPVRQAAVVGIFVPMHTATRLAEPLLGRVRALNPAAHIVVYGLYGPLNRDRLLALGADTVLGGEFEAGLLEVCRRVVAGHAAPDLPVVSLERLSFRVPDRTGLPGLDRYAGIVIDGERRTAGSTEASRGCKYRCRHCPIVPVYDGTFRIVAPEVVMADIAAQVGAGARHITFGDPDFLNGPAHAMRVARALHDAFPEVTYDVTIKVEHLLRNEGLLPDLAETGCVLVTSAVESFDDRVLTLLDKGHTAADVAAAVDATRAAGLALNPTFVAFTPWTTLDGYAGFLLRIASLGLVGAVSPIQYGIRLLVTAGSKLLDLDDITALVDAFDEAGLVYPWRHPDPAVDRLQQRIMATVERAGKADAPRAEVFAAVWEAAGAGPLPPFDEARPDITVPYLTEPWYC